jgi:hypothetical protein
MAGGLLNIVSVGNANVILTGNPTKTFFKVTYSKYTNFGLQKFRLDFEGARDLRLTEESKFTFKMKRYGDLLMDTYLVINLPDIWSPIWQPSPDTGNTWSPFEFKWIENIGIQMIKELEVVCGATTLQKCSGQYLYASMQRDFKLEKRALFDEMTGNIPELNNPIENPTYGRTYPDMKGHGYPSAYYRKTPLGAEPSIRGRSLYIPLNLWFTLDSRCALPLVALQYNELVINVTLRPVQDLFQVRDVFDASNNFPYVRPDFNKERFQLYRFLQTPPNVNLSSTNYETQVNTWVADVHLLSTYCFLSKEERDLFAAEDQVYLIKEVYEYKEQNVTGSSKVKLKSSMGMVSSWTWFLQRSDIILRNEWSNYSNWAYNGQLPSGLKLTSLKKPITNGGSVGTSNIYITGDFSPLNENQILETFGIVIDGDYRENVMPREVYDYVEKYTRTNSFARSGIYCYNFCLNTNPLDYQPSGAFNLSKFKNIELEFTTYIPQVDEAGSNFVVNCDSIGNPVSVSTKPAWALYKYNYDITIFEERYNIISFIGGNCGLMYAR